MVLKVFSVPAFFLVLREVLEACLVVGIMLAYLNKTGNTHLRRYVWMGAASGVVLSLIIGGTCVAIFHAKSEIILEGRTGNIFEGVVFLVAAVLLSWGVLWVQSLNKHVHRAVESATDAMDGDNPSASKVTIFVMVLTQILREGVETFIFLLGASGNNNWRAIPIPGVLAIAIGLATAYAVFRGLLQLDIALFFRISTVLLTAFAAGLATQALHELQEAGTFGMYDEDKLVLLDWWNAPMWNLSGCCDDGENEFFAFLRALFGYQDKPSFIEWATYFFYWLISGAVVLASNWIEIRAAKNAVARAVKAFSSGAIVCGFVSFVFALGTGSWNGILISTLLLVLSIPVVFAAFDTIVSRLPLSIAALRRSVALALCVAFSMLTLLSVSLHMVQMGCDVPDSGCHVPRFYYFGLIFDKPWLETGRSPDGLSWNSLAVLSVSLVLTIYLGGAFSLALGLFAANVLAADGTYLYDADPLKGDCVDEMADAEYGGAGRAPSRASDRGSINPLLA